MKFQILLILGVIPAILLSWVVAAQCYDLDVVWAAQVSILCCVPPLSFAIFCPLVLIPGEGGVRTFIRNWFIIAIFFNIAWQVPQALMMDTFGKALATLSDQKTGSTNGNLPYFIFWWGYSTADLDYKNQTDFFVLAEISYWVINALILPGLFKLRSKESERSGLLFLSISGGMPACLFAVVVCVCVSFSPVFSFCFRLTSHRYMIL
jgi:hypothetical protein